MLLWIFGKMKGNDIGEIKTDCASGTLHLEKATVKWSLSINPEQLPDSVKASGKRTFRSLQIEGREIEFSEGFTDLHTKCYEQILAGQDFGIDDARMSIETVYQLRKSGQP